MFMHAAQILNEGLNSGVLGPIVRKAINANPRLKVNRGLHLAHLKRFLKANFKLMLKTSLKSKLKDKIFGAILDDESLKENQSSR